MQRMERRALLALASVQSTTLNRASASLIDITFYFADKVAVVLTRKKRPQARI